MVKPIFTDAMIARLLELVEENWEDINPDSRKKEANTARKNAWALVTTTLNAEYMEDLEKELIPKQVTAKWGGLKSESKQDLQDQKR
jgi:hypothetical protein